MDLCVPAPARTSNHLCTQNAVPSKNTHLELIQRARIQQQSFAMNMGGDGALQASASQHESAHEIHNKKVDEKLDKIIRLIKSKRNSASDDEMDLKVQTTLPETPQKPTQSSEEVKMLKAELITLRKELKVLRQDLELYKQLKGLGNPGSRLYVEDEERSEEWSILATV